MASPSILDFEALLQPISEDAPTGTDLRSDYSPTSVYYQIKDARAAARAAERAALMEEEADVAGSAEWRQVLELAPTIIAQHSKDLEIASWYIEALARSEGLAGLRDGFRLVRELVERFWDNLYPMPDEEGVSTRVAPLAGLNGLDGEGTLIVPIVRIDITEGQTQGPFATWHQAQARELGRMSEEHRQARLQSGAITQEMFDLAVAETSHDFFRTLIDDLGLCISEFKAMTAALDERCGAADAPGSSQIRTALESVLDTVRFITKDILPPEIDPNAPEDGAEGVDAGPAAETGARVGSQDLQAELARSREEAFQTLIRLSDYFRRTEPHSPVSYLLEQAVRWGRLPLPDLLGELIPDSSARDTYNKLTGIRTAGE